MKICPTCNQTYSDDTLIFCRVDGARLISVTSPADFQETRRFDPDSVSTSILANPLGNIEATRPLTKYARSGDVNIAYQVIGDGPIDLVFVPGWISNIEYGWEQPLLVRFYHRLASFSRLILFDKRGTGLSDQTTDLPTLEQRMDDVRAVMEAVGSERAAVFGMSEGGTMALLFAATYPEHTLALITFGIFAKRVWTADYPWAPPSEQRQKAYEEIESAWGGPVGIEDLAPSLAHNEQFRDWWASYLRRSASPRAAVAVLRMNTSIDVRHILPAIRVPTLVLHRTGDRDSNIEEGRYIAAHIPKARFVELSGDDHLLYAGDQETVLDEVENFLRGLEQTPEADTVLATIMLIRAAKNSGEQETESAEGSSDFPQNLYLMAKRETEWFRGLVHETDGNRLVATFDGPARAVRCACRIKNQAGRAGLRVRIALHTGLCELTGNRIGGPALELAAQLATQSSDDEILVSGALRDLVSGSGIEFPERSVLTLESGGDIRVFAIDCVSS